MKNRSSHESNEEEHFDSDQTEIRTADTSPLNKSDSKDATCDITVTDIPYTETEGVQFCHQQESSRTFSNSSTIATDPVTVLLKVQEERLASRGTKNQDVKQESKKLTVKPVIPPKPNLKTNILLSHITPSTKAASKRDTMHTSETNKKSLDSSRQQVRQE